jgi:hypothetical protein
MYLIVNKHTVPGSGKDAAPYFRLSTNTWLTGNSRNHEIKVLAINCHLYCGPNISSRNDIPSSLYAS